MRELPRYNWRFAACDETRTGETARTMGLPGAMARALNGRGWIRPGPIQTFLNPRLSHLEDPCALTDMRLAAERVWKAISDGEKIAVFADFDADGVSSAALLTGVLKKLGARVVPFIPRRLSEGYGLTGPALKRCLSECAPALILTADCGISSVSEVQFAIESGVDVVVTDHHEPGETLPPALAVVNPRRDDHSASRNLAGVGVAFKLCHALVKIGRAMANPLCETLDLREWLDLVALGTVADVVPLEGENRILVAAGIKRLRSHPSPGLKALMLRAGIESPPGSYHLGFLMGPRINAAGRMTEAAEALELLLCEDAALALQHAALLDKRNAQRRKVEKQILAGVEPQLVSFDPLRNGAVVVGGTGWHPGAIGIVAARLAERFNRPAAVVALDGNGCGRGSVRTAAGVDVLHALRACGNILESGGGHKSAAGFSLRSGALDDMRECFSVACLDQISDRHAKPDLFLDGVLAPSEINRGLCEALDALEPCGEGNPAPRWAMEHLRLAAAPRRMGAGGEHLRLMLRAPGGKLFEAVGFHFGAHAGNLPRGDMMAAFELRINRFRGKESLQLRLLDLRPGRDG